MKIKKIKQFMKTLTVLMFLFCFLPLNLFTNMGIISENDFTSNENSEKHDVTISPLTQEEAVPTIDPITIMGDNVSQFSVLESIISQALFEDPHHNQKTLLDVDNGNMTLEVPDEWTFDREFLNISALYRPHELLDDNNISAGTPPWYGTTNIPKEDGFFGFNEIDPDNELIISGEGEPTNPWVPYESMAIWQQSINKPDHDLSIWETEFISRGLPRYPIGEGFDEDPEWGKNYDNLYGGITTASNTVDLHWNVGNLETYIKAGTSQFTLGNPSIAWETNFGWDTIFIPKKVELSVGWSVENLGYEANDNLSVICRIDGNYVDGRVDSNGTTYNTATSTTIENDYGGEIESHDFIYRLFDITDIINPNITEHTLDFGIWMENINETDDEVRVLFDSIAIIATEEDQYKIGEFGFECSVENFKTQDDLNYWLLFIHLSDEGTGEEIFYPIFWLNDSFTYDDDNPVYFQYDIPSRFKNILNSNESIIFSIGIINLNPFKTYKEDFFVKFDDLTLKPIYKIDDLSKAGLERWIGGSSWEDHFVFEKSINDPYDVSNFQFNLAFNVTNSTYKGSTLEFESLMYIDKIQKKVAEASYYVNNVDNSPIDMIHWNGTFNNSKTFDELEVAQLADENFNPIGYNFTIIDLPAWDGKGNESTDWDWTGGWDPLGRHTPNYVSMHKTNGTSNSGDTQNATVVDATTGHPDYPGSLINGTWVLSFTSKNYLSNLEIEYQTGESSRYYNNTLTNIIANQSSSTAIPGNYSINVRNASGSWLYNFPKYSTQTDNLTMAWTVNDSMGVGNHQILGIWNDTDSITNQTLRIGIKTAYFEVWRTSVATLLDEPGMINSGDLGEFYFNFSQSDGDPLSFAENYIKIYNDASNMTWGTEWPPYQYLIDDVFEDPSVNAEGNYTLRFKTRSVPVANYSVYIMIEKPFFDEQRLDSWINLTGYSIDLNITSGATNTTVYKAYMNSDNLPYVDDASRSVIQVMITNRSNQAPLENAFISGKFNGTENVFYGFEVYQQTQSPSDKGLYNITIDANGLNATDSGQFNYTLTISASVDSYDSTYIEITTEILPILTDIVPFDMISELYEGGSFEFYANYRNVLDPNNHLTINDANLTWALLNGSTIALSGNFTFILGVYHTDIELKNESDYILPGIYNFTINASKFNYANATWTQYGLEVFSKNSTKIELNVPDNIRIGSLLDIQVRLMMIDNSSISDADLRITIIYITDEGNNVSQIVERTDSNGIATYSQQIVPYNYAGDDIEISVTYDGNSTVKKCNNSISKTILGKIPVELSLNYTSELRVGYDLIIDGAINITDVSQYSGIYLTLISWYDGNFLNPTFIQQIAVDQNGSLSYYLSNIADGYDNITIFMDYAGTSTLEYASDEITLDISPKWDVILNVSDLSDSLTMGQEIQLNISADFVSSSTNETFYGLPLYVTYNYENGHEVHTGFFDENARILIPYSTPLESGTWLNITISFIGTDKISGDVYYMDFEILPQMVTHLIILSNTFQQKFAGEFAFSVRLTDDFNVSIEGKNILFIVRDAESFIVADYTAVTNMEGIAEKTIQFEETGEFSIEIVFLTSGIFAGVSSSDSDIDYEVRVVNYGILIIDNIQAILIGIGVVTVISVGVYRGYVVPKRNRQRKALLNIHRRFGDIENMQYVLIMHKETSTSIFSQTFTEIPIDSTLISGFLSAISTFGKEIGNRVEDSQQNAFAAMGDKKTGLEELSYQQFKIVVIEGFYVRTAVLLLKSASPTLRSKIRQFNAEFETKYLSTVEHFSGNIPSPEPILELIEKTLFAYLLYPHNVIPSKAKNYLNNVKKKSTTALVIKEAESSFNNAFRLKEMIVRMAGYGRKEVDTFNVIEKLRQEQVLFAVNPRTQYLIEQFKPMIDPLTKEERLVLKEIYKSGALSEKHIKKNTKIAIVIPIITSLLSKELINEGNSLTEIGEVIATLLNLMPDI